MDRIKLLGIPIKGNNLPQSVRRPALQPIRRSSSWSNSNSNGPTPVKNDNMFGDIYFCGILGCTAFGSAVGFLHGLFYSSDRKWSASARDANNVTLKTIIDTTEVIYSCTEGVALGTTVGVAVGIVWPGLFLAIPPYTLYKFCKNKMEK